MFKRIKAYLAAKEHARVERYETSLKFLDEYKKRLELNPTFCMHRKHAGSGITNVCIDDVAFYEEAIRRYNRDIRPTMYLVKVPFYNTPNESKPYLWSLHTTEYDCSDFWNIYRLVKKELGER